MQQPHKARLLPTDEELLESARAGDLIAQTDLTKRYYDRHRTLAFRASEPLARLFDPSDLAHLFFAAFLHAYNGFRFGHNARFVTYFIVCYRHDLIAEAASSKLFERLNTISLDAEASSEVETSGERAPLAEFIGDPNEDPSRYVDYLDDCAFDCSFGGKLDPLAADIARLRLNGWPFTSIASMMQATPRQCQYLYNRFVDEMRTFMEIEAISRSKGRPRR